MKFKEVTDPELLKELENEKPKRFSFKEVTDPDLLKELNGQNEEKQENQGKNLFFMPKIKSDEELEKTLPSGLSKYNLEGINPLNLIKSGLIGMGTAGKNIAGLFQDSPKNLNLQEIFHQRKNPGILENLVEGTAQYAPLMAASPMLAGAGGIPALVGSSALYGGIQSPENRTKGAIIGGATVGIPIGIGKTVNALRPSNLLKSQLPPEQLARNLELTQGTETGLGDVLGIPMLKRFNENILPKIPFSGATESMQRTAGKVIEKSQNLLDRLAGQYKNLDSDQILSDSVKQMFQAAQNEKNNLYNQVNNLAREANLNLKYPSFNNAINKNLNEIKNSVILQNDSELRPILSKLNILDEKMPQTGGLNEFGLAQNSNLSLQEANILSGKLNSIAQEYFSSPSPKDRYVGKIFKDLGKSLKSDIKQGISQSGNKKLIDSFQTAEENYKNNFSPFLDDVLYKFSSGKADPETLLSTFIKTGKSNDRSNLLNKLMDRLNEDQKNLVGHAYLQRALDENNVINPMKLFTLLSRNSLGDKQFKALFPDKGIQTELRDIVDLTRMNTKGLKLMQNPETGQMNMDILPLISKTPFGLGGKMLAGRPINSYLTSEKVRENLIQKMLKNKGAK